MCRNADFDPDYRDCPEATDEHTVEELVCERLGRLPGCDPVCESLDLCDLDTTQEDHDGVDDNEVDTKKAIASLAHQLASLTDKIDPKKSDAAPTKGGKGGKGDAAAAKVGKDDAAAATGRST